eukprot:14365856-Alexandrium_andersonii.AAC.1
MAIMTAGHQTSKCSELNSPQPHRGHGSAVEDAGLPSQVVAGPDQAAGAWASSRPSSTPRAAATQEAPWRRTSRTGRHWPHQAAPSLAQESG